MKNKPNNKTLKRKVEEAKLSSGDEDIPEEEEDIPSSNFSEDEDIPENVEHLKDSETEPKSKRSKDDLYKAPTREELNMLKENETLFQSSLFRLQIDELLTEVKVKDKVRGLFNKWLQAFSTSVAKIEESPKYDVHDLSWLKKSRIQIPFIGYPLPPKGVFQFIPPKSIKNIGGFPIGISIKSDLCIDVACQMPKNCLQNDDFLNYCYHYKRALYLSYLSMKLQESELVDKLRFQYLNGEELKPVLLINPTGKLGKYATIRLLISLPLDKFKLSKLYHMRNNIRSKVLLGDSSLDEKPPTQHYNNSLLSDALMENLTEYLQKHLDSVQGVCDGIILLKIWAHQRQLDMGYGSMNGFLISMLTAYLLQIKKLNSFMSSYQVVRLTWLALSTMEWDKEGISLSRNSSEKYPTLSDFHKHFPVVFIDPNGILNLCGSMALDMFLKVKNEAKLALKYLDEENSFEILFMTPVPFIRKYDNVIRVNYDRENNSDLQMAKFKEILFHLGGNFEETLRRHLLQLLQKGLGKRVYSIDAARNDIEAWAIKSKPVFPHCMYFGIILDPNNSSRILDVGPPADSVEANEFREFWGEKSDLRRFPDGSISEAVLWEAKSMSEKRAIISTIVSYVLRKHAGINEDDIFYIGSQLDSLLSVSYTSWPENWPPYGTGEEIFTNIMLTLEDLSKQLRSLQDVPYSLSSIQGVGESFRYAEVFPPVPQLHRLSPTVSKGRGVSLIPSKESTVAPEWFPALNVLIKFESEKKWPEDLEAISLMKASVYLTLSQELRKQFQLTCVAHPDYLDVLKGGFVFRLKISYNREVALLKMQKPPGGLLCVRSTEASNQLEKEQTLIPKYTSILHGIQMQHDTFSAACRLGKRWVSSQLLGNHVSETAIELIFAHVYISPSPFTVPRSPQVAFQRFLSLLSKFDWQNFPLIVNFNDELKKDELAEIQKTFSSNRSTLPPMFISTPLDKFTSSWTKSFPNIQVLTYLVSLAKAALEVLENQLMQTSSNFKQIFRPSYKPYDVIIHLNLNQLSRSHENVDVEKILNFEKYRCKIKEQMPVVNYDPVQYYVKELQENYSEFAEFFHDIYGGSVVAVMWKPSSFKPQPFKVSNLSCHKLEGSTTEEGKVIVPNVEMMLDDFANLGLGLVSSVETKTEKWTID